MIVKYVKIKVSAQLAEEYCKAYRRCFPKSSTKHLDDKNLLIRFVEDRLMEEMHFIESEMALVTTKKRKKSSAEKENL